MTVIVSCTSTKDRLHIFRYGILSLLRQTFVPDLLLVNLCQDSFESISEVHQHLPECVHVKNIKVNLVRDVGPHTKLLPALDFASSQDLIITVDDDVLYSSTLVQDLVTNSRNSPDAICCTRARRVIQTPDGNFSQYRFWPNVRTTVEGLDLLPLGVGGVAYKRRFFDEQFLLDPAFATFAPSADDLWFKVASLIERTPVVVDPKLDLANMPIQHRLGLEQMNFAQGTALLSASVKQRILEKFKRTLLRRRDEQISKNDIQWRNTIAYAKSLGKIVSF